MKKNYLIFKTFFTFFILFILITASFQIARSQETVKVRVTCADSKKPNDVTVYVYRVDAAGTPLSNNCGCQYPIEKCDYNTLNVKTETTNGGTAIFKNLEASTRYKAGLRFSCIGNLQNNTCFNSEDCIPSYSELDKAFTTNPQGGRVLPLDINHPGNCLPPKRIETNIPVTDNSSDKLNIFPNPAMNRLYIDISKYEGRMLLHVVNILGLQVISKSIELNGREIYSLDISSLEKGIYKVVMSNGKDIKSGTFVKE